ncbi:MAG TPA: saccharopine dehydrogenase NADP-binding domain-containing protein [Pseudonocardiaceae bacterium]|jgi:saccharopine dehydrogenase (NAD+, L-lysine-forming)|nr:saccharopine dehydrogenase NADP-binding domain-containing protein [Pseudonocardiaceae bacterium]
MTWMVYGANGYTGQLLARLAQERGERPILAGRSEAKIVPLAAALGFDHTVVDLFDPKRLRDSLAGVQVVANCAGPFTRTAAPLVDACLATGTHYLDITGEIDVFEAVYARAAEAEQAGVVLLPGAGFDVVPTDCLAAMLAAALPDAVELDLAFTMGGGISPGTLKTAIESLGAGGRARVDGELRPVPVAHKQTVADFPLGPRRVSAVPWGDLSSAYRSTGIPTITTYTVVPGADYVGRGHELLAPLLRNPTVQKFGLSMVNQLVRGPSEEKQAKGRCEVWGKVRAEGGRTASGALTGPAPYQFTAESVLAAVSRLLAGGIAPGAHTPSSALGADFVRDLSGVSVTEIRVR